MAKKLEEPAGNASTEDWRAYAEQQDPANAEIIAGSSRDDLRAWYGTPADPDAEETPSAAEMAAQLAATAAFANVTPPTPTEVRGGDLFRVTISDQRWDLDAVQLPYGDSQVTVSRLAPLLVPEDEADALIEAAGEHGFPLTKEKLA